VVTKLTDDIAFTREFLLKFSLKGKPKTTQAEDGVQHDQVLFFSTFISPLLL